MHVLALLAFAVLGAGDAAWGDQDAVRVVRRVVPDLLLLRRGHVVGVHRVHVRTCEVANVRRRTGRGYLS